MIIHPTYPTVTPQRRFRIFIRSECLVWSFASSTSSNGWQWSTRWIRIWQIYIKYSLFTVPMFLLRYGLQSSLQTSQRGSDKKVWDRVVQWHWMPEAKRKELWMIKILSINLRVYLFNNTSWSRCLFWALIRQSGAAQSLWYLLNGRATNVRVPVAIQLIDHCEPNPHFTPYYVKCRNIGLPDIVALRRYDMNQQGATSKITFKGVRPAQN